MNLERMIRMTFTKGETYKSYAPWDLDKTGGYDMFEVVVQDGELAFFNHTDKCIYDLHFLGSSDLVKCS